MNYHDPKTDYLGWLRAEQLKADLDKKQADAFLRVLMWVAVIGVALIAAGGMFILRSGGQ